MYEEERSSSQPAPYQGALLHWLTGRWLAAGKDALVVPAQSGYTGPGTRELVPRYRRRQSAARLRADLEEESESKP